MLFQTGFCGIPPALVQRYADELQQDIYDVAEALDRERVQTLQLRGRPAVSIVILHSFIYFLDVEHAKENK